MADFAAHFDKHAAPTKSVLPQQQAELAEKEVEETKNDIQVAMDTMVESTKVFDTEAQGVSREQIFRKTDDRGDVEKNMEETPHASSTYVPALEEALTEFIADDDSVRRKKKKKADEWETKMDELSKMEGQLDDSRLNDEEKQVLGKFFDNMARIRNLKRKWKQLLFDEEKLKEKAKEKLRLEQEKRNAKEKK